MLFFDVAVSAAVLALAYFSFRSLFSFFAKSEVRKSNKVKRKAGTLQIYADAESLEYYIRMSLSAEPHMAVVVNIDKNSAEAEELAYIAGIFAHRTKNLKINYII
ncbi:MAG: hypothetical protein J6C89_06870 [Clostridia bacterium]|nr:hypothetical protein [Clostridia bacterium]